MVLFPLTFSSPSFSAQIDTESKRAGSDQACETALFGPPLVTCGAAKVKRRATTKDAELWETLRDEEQWPFFTLDGWLAGGTGLRRKEGHRLMDEECVLVLHGE